MPPIDFPTSTAPGLNATENGGRLINCYAEKAPEGSRSKALWRRAPGLIKRFETGAIDPRGAITVGDVLYVISGDKAYSVLPNYTVTQLSGTVGGSGPVFMARNMAATPDILIVHSAGMSKIDIGAASVADFSDPDLPAPNSICWIDGYFMVSSAAGKVYQSGINATTFSSVDFTTAEADPDGLVRVIAIGRDLAMMGVSTIEFWGNAGNPTGFAFNRGPVLSVGLKGPYAATGFEPGFSLTPVFVANDNTVRRLDGYTPTRISTPALERLIEAVEDPDDIEASCYVASGHQCITITGPDWSWSFDLSTQSWFERQSYGADRWRARFGINAFDEWLTFDRDSGKVFAVSSNAKTEDGDPLIWDLSSNQAHRFPGRLRINRASFDFVTGVGIASGADPIEAHPVARISYSDDGARTWSPPREFSLGPEGQDVSLDWWRAGITNRRGRQWRIQISDPVEAVFFGAAMDIEELAA